MKMRWSIAPRSLSVSSCQSASRRSRENALIRFPPSLLTAHKLPQERRENINRAHTGVER